MTDEELAAIAARLAGYERPAVGSWEWHLRDAANDVDMLLDEVERLRDGIRQTEAGPVRDSPTIESVPAGRNVVLGP